MEYLLLLDQEKFLQLLIDGLRKLEYRGYDSAGIATIENSNNDQFGELKCQKIKRKAD